MNEIETIYAAKLMSHLVQDHPISSVGSNFEELLAELSSTKNSLHLCFNKVYTNQNQSIEEMSIEEYRSYTETRIRTFKLHPSQQSANYTVHITEEGLEAMKEDPYYENYVLESIQSAFGHPFLSPFSDQCLLYFGATKEDSYGMSWSSMKQIHGYEKESYQEEASVPTEQNELPISAYKKSDTHRITDYIPTSRIAKALYAYNVMPDFY